MPQARTEMVNRISGARPSSQGWIAYRMRRASATVATAAAKPTTQLGNRIPPAAKLASRGSRGISGSAIAHPAGLLPIRPAMGYRLQGSASEVRGLRQQSLVLPEIGKE